MQQDAPRRRVLIITYYWPPSGGSGVQRWLKFARYLPEQGWDPVVYTPSNPESPALDPALEAEIPPTAQVIRRPIVEPYTLYRRFMGMREGQSVGTRLTRDQAGKTGRHGLSMWIRGNLFIPDPRVTWVRPSVRFLHQELRRRPVDAIVTTGPPHSMHLIGLGLSRLGHAPWVADFRDPWSRIDYFGDLRLTPPARRRHLRLEREVLEGADAVLTTSPGTAGMFRQLAACDPAVIPNGYDPADFEGPAPPRREGFTAVHVGMLDRTRHHPRFWDALERLATEDPQWAAGLRVRLVGKVDPSILADLQARPALAGKLEFTGYLSHPQSVAAMRSADLLLSFIADAPDSGITIPGKLFEYMAAGPPILHLDRPGSDAWTLLEQTNAGLAADSSDPGAILRALRRAVAWARSRAGRAQGEEDSGNAGADAPAGAEQAGKISGNAGADAPAEGPEEGDRVYAPGGAPARRLVARYSRKATAADLARLLESLQKGGPGEESPDAARRS